MSKDVYNQKQIFEHDDDDDDDDNNVDDDETTFQGYFHTLAGEVFQHNIHVTLTCPGPVYSNALAVAYTDKIGEVRHKCCT